jgi:cytochrome P450
VRLLTASANRDEAVFADGECLKLGRANAREHLALGFGPHFCLGASLARLEGSLAFAALVRRFPGLELASDQFEWTGSSTLRRLKALPVSLDGKPRRGRAQTLDAGASATSSASTRLASTSPSM